MLLSLCLGLFPIVAAFYLCLRCPGRLAVGLQARESQRLEVYHDSTFKASSHVSSLNIVRFHTSSYSESTQQRFMLFDETIMKGNSTNNVLKSNQYMVESWIGGIFVGVSFNLAHKCNQKSFQHNWCQFLKHDMPLANKPWQIIKFSIFAPSNQ